MTTTARTLAIRTSVLAAVLAVGWWALRPLETPDLSLPDRVEQDPELEVGPAMQVALDDAAFHAPLWLAPPPPPAPAAEPPKPEPLAPLKLQLLAIVRGPGAEEETPYRAMLYDPDSDKIIEVAAGDLIAGRTVVGVTPHEITLRDRAGTRTLSLRSEGSASGTGGGGGS